MNILTSTNQIDTSSTTRTKRYKDLKPGDEFQTLLGARLKRVRVSSYPVHQGSTVEIRVHGRRGNDRGKLRFTADAEVTTFTHLELIPTPQKISSRTTYDRDRYERIVRQGLEGSLYPRSIRQIKDVMWKQGEFSLEGLRQTLKRMAEEGHIKESYGPKNLRLYRLPIVWEAGMKVVENQGRPSERYGWVDKVQEMRNGSLLPICLWTGGGRSPSSDSMLEICTNPYQLERIEIAQLHAQGQRPEGFIKEVPWYLWDGIILTDQTRRGLVSGVALLAIAQHLGFVKPEACTLNHLVRRQTVDYLNKFYPDWKQQHTQEASA